VNALGTAIPWDQVAPHYQAKLTETLAGILGDRDPAEHWDQMGARSQADWLYFAEHGVERVDTFAEDAAAIAAVADSATGEAFRALDGAPPWEPVEEQAAYRPQGPDEVDTAARLVKLTAASSIRVRPVRWVWQDRLAFGTLALPVAEKASGKVW
jgi:hypothetical protein